MIIRHSRMHGRLENEVEDFIATLENEFCFDVQSVVVRYRDNVDDIDVMHTFLNPKGDSNFEEIETKYL